METQIQIYQSWLTLHLATVYIGFDNAKLQSTYIRLKYATNLMKK